jgi:hypothetical protein
VFLVAGKNPEKLGKNQVFFRFFPQGPRKNILGKIKKKNVNANVLECKLYAFIFLGLEDITMDICYTGWSFLISQGEYLEN